MNSRLVMGVSAATLVAAGTIFFVQRHSRDAAAVDPSHPSGSPMQAPADHEAISTPAPVSDAADPHDLDTVETASGERSVVEATAGDSAAGEPAPDTFAALGTDFGDASELAALALKDGTAFEKKLSDMGVVERTANYEALSEIVKRHTDGSLTESERTYTAQQVATLQRELTWLSSRVRVAPKPAVPERLPVGRRTPPEKK